MLKLTTDKHEASHSLSATAELLAIAVRSWLHSNECVPNVLCRCIDGFSRNIMWLKASYTNHKPALIASFFLDAVQRYGGYPVQVSTDCGTENGTVATIQSYVTGSTSGHIYNTSPGNQRIEAWWLFFLRNHSQFWIDLFEDLTEFGSYDLNRHMQMDCLRFCFMSVVQRELDSVCV